MKKALEFFRQIGANLCGQTAVCLIFLA